MPETDGDGIYFNAAVLIDRDGVIGRHRKSHPYISEPKWARLAISATRFSTTPIGRIEGRAKILRVILCLQLDKGVCHAVEPEGSKLLDGGVGQHCVSRVSGLLDWKIVDPKTQARTPNAANDSSPRKSDPSTPSQPASVPIQMATQSVPIPTTPRTRCSLSELLVNIVAPLTH
jgi:hypothetical protein